MIRRVIRIHFFFLDTEEDDKNEGMINLSGEHDRIWFKLFISYNKLLRSKQAYLMRLVVGFLFGWS